jgi:predicted N-acyltransferase
MRSTRTPTRQPGTLPPDARTQEASAMKFEVVDGIGQLQPAQWNRLSAGRYPFLRHEFMLAAEGNGCVSESAGWSPRHLALFDRKGRLRAAMPLYEKTHSWGEFVFDWAWAQAYDRVGLDYYPKLVSASPFTPAQSARLLLANEQDAEAAASLAAAALKFARDEGHSSLHVQFPLQSELSVLTEAGMKLRKDCQFHWHNQGYQDFDEFLATFSSAKRKKAKRDRRHVAEQGIRFRWLDGEELDDSLWDDIYRLISITFLRRGSMPYLSCDFFCDVSRQLPQNILALIAEHNGQTIAAAVFYRNASALYGRYWGADGDYNALHFETCYYQGIDYCIRHNLDVFEPGTQGEHKISRGFSPVTTWSAHWLARPEFFDAIGDYLESEGQHIDAYMDAVRAHTPYRNSDDSNDAPPDKP